jgi:hypothetical protein
MARPAPPLDLSRSTSQALDGADDEPLNINLNIAEATGELRGWKIARPMDRSRHDTGTEI